MPKSNARRRKIQQPNDLRVLARANHSDADSIEEKSMGLGPEEPLCIVVEDVPFLLLR